MAELACPSQQGCTAVLKRGQLVEASQVGSTHPYGLIVECDGVLVDIHKDAHRVAFNKAFEVTLPICLPQDDDKQTQVHISFSADRIHTNWW